MDAAPQEKSGASKRRNRLVRVVLTLIAILAVVVVFIVTSPFVASYLVVYQADEGFKRAKKTIDPEQLRAWALKEVQNHGETNSSSDISNSEIPTAIRNLYSYPPESAFISENTVIVMWGGGFFGWSVQIGNTNFSLPFKSGNPDLPYNFKWVEGIYYSRECDWKLQ